MNDVLLKNLKLTRELKKLVKAVLNGNFDKKFCECLLNRAIVRSILSQDPSLIRDFRKYANKKGFIGVDFEEVKRELFDNHEVSQIGDSLCNSLEHKLSTGKQWISACNDSVYDAVSIYGSMTIERILSECRKERNKLPEGQYEQLAKRINKLELDHKRLIDAVERMDINAFKKNVAPKTGIDAGPEASIMKGQINE